MPAKKITKDKVAYYIENIHETTERIDIKSQKKLSEESRVPKYIIEALVKTGFLYKKESGVYACRLNTKQTSNRFYLDLAEKVLCIHYKPDFNRVDFTAYRWEYIVLPFREIEKPQTISQDPQQKRTEKTEDLSFWNKIKKFFGL